MALEQLSLESVVKSLRVLTGLLWIVWGGRLFVSTYSVPGTNAVTIFYTVAGGVLMGLALLPLKPFQTKLLDAFIVCGTLVAGALWTYDLVYAAPGYGTDEIALAQGAAETLLHGRNPYATDISLFMQQFSVPPSSWTVTLDGGIVNNLNYPALSFLSYIPLLALGIKTQTAVFVDLSCFILGFGVMWCILPHRFRPFVPIVASLNTYAASVSGGLIANLILPFMILSVWGWDRFVNPEYKRLVRYIGPISLGFACATIQNAWFFAPFLVIGIAMEAHARGLSVVRKTAEYVFVVAISFMLPNVYFIVWNPIAWMRGVLYPLVQPLMPLGQGLVGISLYVNHGTGSLFLYSLAALFVIVVLCLALIIWYDHFKNAICLFPAIIFLFPTRSLLVYFLFSLPLVLVSMTTTSRPLPTEADPYLVASENPLQVGYEEVAATKDEVVRYRPKAKRDLRWRKPLIVVSVVGSIGVFTSLFTAMRLPPPLSLQITGVQTTGQVSTVDEVKLQVSNRSSGSVTPHFEAGIGPYVSVPWIIGNGPRTLQPGMTATYTLWAPNVYAMPRLNTGFKIYATSIHPSALSASDLYRTNAEHTQITPEAIDSIVSKGHEVELYVHVLNDLNQPVRQAGIKVDLSQTLYTEQGLTAGETSINGAAEGQSPVSAVTNSQGIARFTIRALQVQPHEVFYQAWIEQPFPRGYSRLVTIRFGS